MRGKAPGFSGGRGRGPALQARDAVGKGGGRGRGGYKKTLNGNYMNGDRGKPEGAVSAEESNKKLLQTRAEDALEELLGFPLFTDGEDKLGWLMNMQPSSAEDKDTGQNVSAVDCYYMCQDGTMFKSRQPFAPYFYLQVCNNQEFEVEGFLRRRFEGLIKEVEPVEREDLDLKNHLSGLKRKLLKLSFWNVQQLMEVRREVQPIIAKNKARARTTQAYAELAAMQGAAEGNNLQDVTEFLEDMREYDVPYHVRFAIDCDIRCGYWYNVKCQDGVTTMEWRSDLLQRAEPRVCAWDIECTKLPLQFPNAEYDQVFMISYMLDRQGYLITNREVVGSEIEEFEYTPKPEFEGPFVIFNEPNEKALLKRFFSHMQETKPAVFVTYNGDFFDFPFVEKRAARNGMDLYQELGFKVTSSGEVLARHAVHMDCLHWVNRDSYLPQGSRGLKAVTKAKLGYDPVEVAPEDMVRMAAEQPQAMAAYSVSDAVSTYYLYMTYINPFIFSLATIIPMPPDEVLRKGSGTLCEQLLMVQAFKSQIVCPNKHASEQEVFYKGHLLDSETYIGGKVEAIESGVFRSDLPMRFKLKPAAYQALIDRLDSDLKYAITHECKMQVEDISNYAEVRDKIAAILTSLRDTPNREEAPLIYHLDVAAMYPNIILTNRLQPPSIVTDEDCAACDFNKPGKTCLRQMEWLWRGEHYAAGRAEYMAVKNQLQAEAHPPQVEGGPPRYWEDLGQEERAKLLKDRLKLYTHKVYKRVHDKPITESRTAGICQRENDFYVGTVRAFRDRRYEYKALNKTWKNKHDAAKGDMLKTQEAADMCVLYESLQLAHKCILNSFYGYVMRKGARWYSMEMAGVVTYTGAKIIERACKLVEQLGRPLELDTDGIWCALPASFPEVFKLKNGKTGKDVKISYPCIMLNVMLVDHNTNDQYQTLVDPEKKTYETSSQMSIEFEVDGPYKAMILPASKEEGKTIKKRYAVFNDDGSLAELKGFEIKRRGELKLIKVFQAEVFEQFLEGNTLEECYHAVASVANRWLDLLDTQGTDLTDEELVDHISEATTMSKGIDEYDGRKSCAITCAKRLGAFLGDEQIKDKGLNCTYVIAKKPEGQSTTERAIPVSIFSAEPAVARAFLRKWCGGDVGSAPVDAVPDVRDIVDWDYYRERLGNTIQKIITIPAAMQGVANPVPRVRHPDWLHKKLAEINDKCQQLKLDAMMPMLRAAGAKNKAAAAAAAAAAEGNGGRAQGGGDVGDMEELAGRSGPGKRAAGGEAVAHVTRMQGSKGAQANGAAGATNGTSAQGAQAGDIRNGAAAAAPTTPVGPPPNLREDYAGWLGHQKAKWRQQRGERKKRRLDAEAAARAASRGRPGNGAAAGDTGAVLGVSKGGAKGQVGALFRQQQAAVTGVPWQLLQLADTVVPGRFKMWFLADGRVHHVHLCVPRTLYVDSEILLENAPADSARFSQATPGNGLMMLVARIPGAVLQPAPNKILPGGKKPVHLYEMSMPESEYVAAVPALSTALSAPHIRSVYEERMPLSLSASLALGCVVKVAPHAANKSLTGDFQVSDFKVSTSTETPYLELPPGMNYRQPSQSQQLQGPGVEEEPLGPNLRYVALFSSGDASHGRAVFCLYMPASCRALLVVVQPSASAVREVSVALLERAWREAVHAAAAAAAAGEPVGYVPPQVEWTVEYARDALDAGRLLQRALVSHKREQRGAMVCAVQAPQSSGHLAVSAMPALSEVPCVDVPSHAGDSKYPPLQWQARAARRAAHRVSAIGEWLRERAALARYAHVPLANLAGDATVAVADVLFARNLRAANHLLWVCDVTLPDLGVESKGDDGDVDDAASTALPAAHVVLPAAAAGAAALAGGNVGAGAALRRDTAGVSPEVVSAGAYRSISVELKLHHLAVAAVQQAAVLGDLEGSSSVEGASGSAGPAFKVLKNLVAAWLQDASANMNQIADALLQSLYRWVCHPSSALRDPALQTALQTLMAKLFAQLVSEMRRLGAVIVAANFNTVIICTGKRNATAAVGYTQYLLDALRKRELFSWLDLAPQRWWHVLLFRDPYNWGGIDVPEAHVAAAKQQAGMGGGEAEEDCQMMDDAEPTVRYQWNLKEYLPPALQEEMVLLLTEFIYLPWKEAQAAEQQGASQAAGSQAAAVAHTAEDLQTTYLQKAVPGYFTERLLKLVGEAARSILPSSEHPAHQFPQLAGSYLSKEELGSPALAFVRTICALLSLDIRCTDAVAILRRQLLKLLKVREFSQAADFKEACLALTLPDVICSYCNDCRDLDLCRDEQLVQHSKQQDPTTSAAGTRRAEGDEAWCCRQCKQSYDMEAIEQRLVVALNQHVRTYELQDLACVRCRAVTSSHLRGACGACGGDLRCTVPSNVRRTQLTVFRNVAAFHGFPLLHEMAEWLLQDGQIGL